MRRPSLSLLGCIALGLACFPAHAEDTFSVAPHQSVAFGDGEGDAFAIESISPHANAVTILLRPQGEDCTFRFDVSVGRSVQLRTPGMAGQMLCKATLQPLTGDGTASFGAECTEEPVSTELKCPPDSDTAVNNYPQRQ